nr:MAG TPA: hypothetical protein [Caudoviricetes sp.]
MFTRGATSDSVWGAWYKVITGGDALTSSASAISSTNNYFTAGATTALIAAKTASAVGNYLPLTGGTLTGKLQVNDVIYGYRYSKKNDAPAFVFDKPGTGLTGIGAHGTDTIYFSAVTNDGNFDWNNDYKQKWVFNGAVTATTVTADYFNGLAANSQKLGGYSLTNNNNYFDVIPLVRADGVMEVGHYLDFHNTSPSTFDYDVRV